MDKGCSALPTDISDTLLKEAQGSGYISEYQKENAEQLSFSDASFDYVFCKEAYHHFPRPLLALYEMLRVASKGVAVIEPNDHLIFNSLRCLLWRKLKNTIKRMIGKKNDIASYEPVGNYVYPVSRREFEKVALGLNYKMIAFKGINEHYIQGVEYEKIEAKGPLQKEIKRKIGFANFLCKLGLQEYDILCIIIFKQAPSPELLSHLQKAKYTIKILPENPYLS
jgi:ubiquinone/menaquinone biosynthesis C-methylase UbiE